MLRISLLLCSPIIVLLKTFYALNVLSITSRLCPRLLSRVFWHEALVFYQWFWTELLTRILYSSQIVKPVLQPWGSFFLARALLLCSKELAKRDTLRQCWSKPRNCYWHISTTKVRPKLTVIIKQQLRFHLWRPSLRTLDQKSVEKCLCHRSVIAPAGILQKKKFQFSKISGYLWTGPSSLIVWTFSSVILEYFHRMISFKANAKR